MSFERSPDREIGGRRGFDSDIEAQLLHDSQTEALKYVQEHPDVVAWVRESLDSIDFDELRLIYSEVAKKSGVREMNFITQERIFVTSGENMSGSAHFEPAGNQVAINGGAVA